MEQLSKLLNQLSVIEDICSRFCPLNSSTISLKIASNTPTSFDKAAGIACCCHDLHLKSISLHAKLFQNGMQNRPFGRFEEKQLVLGL